MAIGEFYNASRVLIVAGKGGVGKTTVGATVAVAAARAGASVLCIELDGHSALGRPFGVGPLDYEPTRLVDYPSGGVVQAMRLTPDDALVDYLRSHGLDRIAGRLLTGGAIDVVSSAAPGIRDLVALGKIAQLERTSPEDLIVVDAPAAGHALSFLQAPAGLRDTGDGPIREQAERVLDMLGDPDRCQVMLVTTPEDTPVTETIETAYSLEDLVGLQLAPIAVNGLLPTLPGLAEAVEALGEEADDDPASSARRAAAHHRLTQQGRQTVALERLRDELPLPALELPRRPATDLGLDDFEALADALEAAP